MTIAAAKDDAGTDNPERRIAALLAPSVPVAPADEVAEVEVAEPVPLVSVILAPLDSKGTTCEDDVSKLACATPIWLLARS